MSAFKIVVKTDNTGTSATNQFTLPLSPGAAYNFHVDWGDESEEDIVEALGTDHTHTYSEAGTYEISITENILQGFPLIYFYNRYDKLKLLQISAWGTNKWTSLYRSFYGCANMTITATDHPTANTGSVVIADYAFCGCAEMSDFPQIDLHSVTTAIYAWGNSSKLVTFAAIDMPSCQCFSYTWRNDYLLENFPEIDVSAGLNFVSTWENNTSLATFPLLDFSNATSLKAAWKGCSGLNDTFPLIDTGNVTDLTSTWHGCPLVTFPQINTSKCTKFANTWRSTNIVDFPFLDFSKGDDFFETWAHCHFTRTIPAMDFSKGKTFEYCWWECWELEVFPKVSFDEGINFYGAFGDSGIKYFPNMSFPKGEDFSYAFKNVSLTSMESTNFPSLNNGYNMFYGATLNPKSYSAILKNFVENNLNDGIDFSAGTTDYYKSVRQYRNVLIGRGWSLTDGNELEDPMAEPNTVYSIATIYNPAADLTDFVLAIDLSTLPTQFKEAWDTSSGGYGRAYKDSDGTELACSWININSETKTGTLKVKWSGFLYSEGSQKIRIYPPNTLNAEYAADDTYGNNAVYTGHIAYYPLQADPNEKTGKGYNLSNSGAVLQESGGYLFDGIDSYLSEGTNKIAATAFQSGFTIFAIINPTTRGENNGGRIIDKSTADLNGFTLRLVNPNIVGVYRGASYFWSGGDFPDGASRHLAVKIAANGDAVIFVNGAASGSPGNVGALTDLTSTNPIRIGNNSSATNRTFNGLIKDVNILSGDKSEEWIAEDYLQESGQETFWGDWEYVEPVLCQSDKLIAGQIIHI